MKSLSDDITIKLPTTGMAEGYVITTIYANGIGVFTGRSYIPGDDSSLYVNVNDIAVQNRGKDDYLKLNDDGYVETVPLVNDKLSTYSYQRRWNIGQVGNYKVNITDNINTFENSEYVLTGYDYPNRDLKPTSMDEEDSSLCRIMQGCDWIYNHDEEIGSFYNLLLPHYPLVKTNKYGFGLQIGAGNIPLSRPNTPYSLRRNIGPEVELGSPIFGLSNTTFLTLDALITGITGTNDNDSDVSADVSVYLKQSDASNDEFGDWKEGREWFRGRLNVSGIRVTGSKDGQIVYDETFNEGDTFINYIRRYIEAIIAPWDINKIIAGNREIYRTDWKPTQQQASYDMDVYEDNYDTIEIGKSTSQELQYDHLFAGPVYEEIIDDRYDSDEYVGQCTIAVLDSCYSRYYLAWNDRYGDIQSQPFDGKIEYTEDTQKTEIKDYKMRRREVHNELQPKWKLNTKWLSEDVYPMYESIFISPYLLLYDTQTDRSWNVIVTDNKYAEKTYKNQKSLFNLEITVEANTKENRIF